MIALSFCNQSLEYSHNQHTSLPFLFQSTSTNEFNKSRSPKKLPKIAYIYVTGKGGKELQRAIEAQKVFKIF